MALMRPGGYWRTVGELGTLGLSFVIALAIGTVGGLWIDDRFGTSPWGLLVGFALGFAAAILNVYRITTRALASSKSTGPRPARPEPDGGTDGAPHR
jgi:F0F1-type ATP synthase assembly protein I